MRRPSGEQPAPEAPAEGALILGGREAVLPAAPLTPLVLGVVEGGDSVIGPGGEPGRCRGCGGQCRQQADTAHPEHCGGGHLYREDRQDLP